jgi:acetate kinase
MRLLVVNVGSSSLKLSVVEDGSALASESIAVSRGRLDEGAAAQFATTNAPLDAVAHRIVHGGTEFRQPVVVDDRVRARLAALVDLAPLHLPKSLAGIDLFSRLLPGVTTVACFDTAFHAGIPEEAATYALPVEWRRRWPLRRFGFHGLSHAWVTRRATEMTGRPAESMRLVSCHLGAGASLAAIADGRSVDTTMGFTPLEGLVMATRSGSVDPGLVLWLEEHVGLPPAELASTLESRSGLLGLAGTPDLRAVLQAESGGDPDAALALGVYVHRLCAEIAAMVAALGGLDVLAFTGGVGERSAPIRARAAARLGFLGVALDEAANDTAVPDTEVGAPGAAVRVLVVAAREDLEIAGQVATLLGVEHVLEQ